MSERYESFKATDSRLKETQYGSSESNVRARWDYYECATSPIEVDDIITESIGIDRYESVIDVGCGDAELLQKLRNKRHHEGPMIGVELFESKLVEAQERIDADINLVAGNAEALPFADNSTENLLAMFMLYHVDDIEAALNEFKRVTIPGGKIVVATSGPENKPKHRKFEEDIADYLGIAKPPIFAERFDSDVARNVLPEWFEIETVIPQHTNILITEDETYERFIGSLNTMKNAFNPTPSDHEWQRAIEDVVEPQIASDMYEYGRFNDKAQRHYFICRNIKKKSIFRR